MENFQVLKWNEVLLNRLGISSKEFLSKPKNRLRKSPINCTNMGSGVYWMTEQKCRKWMKIMPFYLMIHLSPFTIAFFYAIYRISTGHIDPSTRNLPFNAAVPFDTNVVWGWFLKWLFEVTASAPYGFTMFLTSFYFVCILPLHHDNLHTFWFIN